MLLGRERECETIDRLLATAWAGEGRALVLRGEAGIGKTALLGYATGRARDTGGQVLSTLGVEREADLPFAGLSSLVGPILDQLPELPTPQAAALRGALALGPSAPGGRFAASAATLSLLAAAARERPLLAVVDDAHWLDAASAEALSFTARRLGSENIAMLFAVREGEPTSFEPSGVDGLEVSGLSRRDAAALLAGRGSPASSEVVDRLVDALRGNPLALVEASGLLSDEQLSGRDLLDQPLSVGTTLEQTFLRRVRDLPEEVGKLLVLAAASGTETMEAIVRAATTLGLEPRDLEQAETAGILTIQGQRLEWRHPLVRSAVYHGADAAERRAAHRALADALSGERAADRRARHLAAAAVEPDEDVAEELEHAALDARRRGGSAAAASTFKSAAALTPDSEQRARRLLEAARDLQAAGRAERAHELLDEALERTRDPLLRADVQRVRGWTEMWRGAPQAAYELLVAEAARVEHLSPERATMMLIEAGLACSMRGDIARALTTGERACKADASTTTHALAVAALASPLVLAGQAERARPSLVSARQLFDHGDALELVPMVQTAGHVSVWLEDYVEAGRVLESVIEACRTAGAAGLLPFPLACLSELDFRAGRWAAAYAAGAESLSLAEEVGQANESAFSLVNLARVEAGRGAEEDCRAHVTRALEIAGSLDIGSIHTYALSVLGLLELGLGRPERALIHLQETAELVARQGLRDPSVVQWGPDLIMAYVRAGRIAEAERALEEFAWQAEDTGRSWALAAASRCRGLLADDAHFEEHFETALAWHAHTPTPFPRALTELSLGERLRRARRPIDARPPLRAALEALERLGAEPWSAQARGELAATGERVTPHSSRGLGELTAQELQAALLVARGTTNREAAAALFLSPKTIEFHLGKAYRKLGVRSRTELAALVAAAEPRLGEPGGLLPPQRATGDS